MTEVNITAAQEVESALDKIAEAQAAAEHAKESARVRRVVLLAEAKDISALIGLVPLSELEGIAESPAKAKPGRKPKKAGEKKSRPALGRGVEKGKPEAV